MEGAVSNKLIWSLKTRFAESVAKKSNSEVFGIKTSEKSWDCLYEQYLIIDILESYKKKCQDFCVKFNVIDYLGSFYLVVDDVDFTAIVGDVVDISIDSTGYYDGYTLTDIVKSPSIPVGLYAHLLSLGFTSNVAVLTSDGFAPIEESVGDMILETDYEITFDDRELSQEDLDCLIEKIC